jgi:NDP-sugar pyrophosphorylase family protein
MRDVQAVILAGGRGTRLRPITLDRPKPLVPVANRPLIVHQLHHLVRAGVKDVTLALGYSADQFRSVEDEADRLGVNLRLVTEPEPRGTGGALRWCYDQGVFDDRPLLWMNGDVIASPDVDVLADFHDERDSVLTLWLTSARDVSQFGVLELEDDGRVRRFLEKPAPEESDSHLVNAGILLLDPALLERVPSGIFYSFEQNLLPEMVRSREPVYGMFDGSYWLDIGRPPFFRMANRHVLEQRVDWQPEGEEIEPGLWIGKNVQLDAVVIHPAAFGDGTVLEPGAQLFGRTVLGSNVTVREGVKLDDSVLFDDVEIGRGTEISNSAICTGARIGEGVVLQNSMIGRGAIVGDRNEVRGARLWGGVEVPPGTLVIDMDR